MTAREAPPNLEEAKRRLHLLQRKQDETDDVTADDPHLTDLGNAKRLVARHGEDLRYCQARGAWLVWDGCRWAWDECGEVERRARETVLSWFGEAAELPKDDRRKLISHAMKCESASVCGP
jgi:phage/plasmid-associated DNA primase